MSRIVLLRFRELIGDLLKVMLCRRGNSETYVQGYSVSVMVIEFG